MGTLLAEEGTDDSDTEPGVDASGDVAERTRRITWIPSCPHLLAFLADLEETVSLEGVQEGEELVTVGMHKVASQLVEMSCRPSVEDERSDAGGLQDPPGVVVDGHVVEDVGEDPVKVDRAGSSCSRARRCGISSASQRAISIFSFHPTSLAAMCSSRDRRCS